MMDGLLSLDIVLRGHARASENEKSTARGTADYPIMVMDFHKIVASFSIFLCHGLRTFCAFGFQVINHRKTRTDH